MRRNKNASAREALHRLQVASCFPLGLELAPIRSGCRGGRWASSLTPLYMIKCKLRLSDTVATVKNYGELWGRIGA